MLFRRAVRLHHFALTVALALIAAPSCRPAPLIVPPEGQLSAPVVLTPETPLLALPPVPELSPAGHALILEFETDGRAGFKPRPDWPRGESGFTIGIGYDCGYFSRGAIAEDWHELPPPHLTRVEAASGIKGAAAVPYVRRCQDILIAWELATGVFDRVDVSRTWAQCVREYPGFLDLRPNCQSALVSLDFNRGNSTAGPNRTEIREIIRLTPKRDYPAIAQQFRKMVRVWVGTDIYAGMYRRRYAEAALVLTP